MTKKLPPWRWYVRRRRKFGLRGTVESYFWIGIGAALGGVARFWLSGVVAALAGEAFPLGTLIINVLGSFDHWPGWALSGGDFEPAIRHDRDLRRLHHLLLVQFANPQSHERRRVALCRIEYCRLLRAVPAGGVDRACGRTLPQPMRLKARQCSSCISQMNCTNSFSALYLSIIMARPFYYSLSEASSFESVWRSGRQLASGCNSACEAERWN